MRDPHLTRLFMDTFQDKISTQRTVRSAYHHTELYWSEQFGNRFYKNYETFRSAKSQYLKKVRFHSHQKKTC